MHYLNTIGSLVTKYVPDYLNEIVEQLVLLWELDTSTFVYGSGKRKSKEQRHYEHLTTFCQKLQEYIQKIEICGPNRNSYSKTDNSATFMRIKTDYMGNDQLLPAYNVFGIMKNDRWYKRIVRRGIHSVKLEVLLVAIGHNLYKYQKKR